MDELLIKMLASSLERKLEEKQGGVPEIDPIQAFEEMMLNIIESKPFEETKNKIIAQLQSINSENVLISMVLLSAKNNTELIKAAAGFAFMSDEIKAYYKEPAKAYAYYSEKFGKD